ncbi:MAG: hypothetical protein ACQEQ8_04860 [Pseudomonadota bacterium]
MQLSQRQKGWALVIPVFIIYSILLILGKNGVVPTAVAFLFMHIVLVHVGGHAFINGIQYFLKNKEVSKRKVLEIFMGLVLLVIGWYQILNTLN